MIRLSKVLFACLISAFLLITLAPEHTQAKIHLHPQQILVLPLSNTPDGTDCSVSGAQVSCSVKKQTEGAAVLADQTGNITVIGQNSITITSVLKGITVESIYTNMDSLNPAILSTRTASIGDQIGTLAANNTLYVTFVVNSIPTNPNGWWINNQPMYYGTYIGGFWDNTSWGGPDTDLGTFCHKKNSAYVRAHWGATTWLPWHCIYADSSEGEILDLQEAHLWAANLLGYADLILYHDGISPFRMRLYQCQLVAA